MLRTQLVCVSVQLCVYSGGDSCTQKHTRLNQGIQRVKGRKNHRNHKTHSGERERGKEKEERGKKREVSRKKKKRVRERRKRKQER